MNMKKKPATVVCYKRFMSILDTSNRTDHTKSLAFLDHNGGPTLQRYEKMKYPQFDKLTDRQIGFFWRPQEIAIDRDAKDFKELTAHEQHIFSSNLKRQILLDSVQGRSPNLALLPVVSLPELEAWITAWSFFELIHSRSYTRIIQNVYTNPTSEFDEMFDIPEITECAVDITKYYDELIERKRHLDNFNANPERIRANQEIRRTNLDGTSNPPVENIPRFALKKSLWMTLMSINILEGVRFYVSFACSFAFAETKRMEGNAKIIKLICRDENLHLASTQMLLKILPQDDPDYLKISEQMKEESIRCYIDAVEQEKAWAQYLFKDGSMIGLNYELLVQYVEWMANKRMVAIGLPPQFKQRANPLPWMQKWISGADVQTAPQESEIITYTVGDIKQDLTENIFKDITL